MANQGGFHWAKEVGSADSGVVGRLLPLGVEGAREVATAGSGVQSKPGDWSKPGSSLPYCSSELSVGAMGMGRLIPHIAQVSTR